MQIRVESLPVRIDPADALLLKGLQQVPFRQLDALEERFAGFIGVLFPIFTGGFQSALDIVCDA